MPDRPRSRISTHFAIHARPLPIGAGRRAVLYWIVGYLTILYPLITIVVVRRDYFGSSRFGAKT